jgi:hypothetical protein
MDEEPGEVLNALGVLLVGGRRVGGSPGGSGRMPGAGSPGR